jgi:diguanylate cyclase (GGDEF)-like protein/PAS domain S-box-containing protein
MNSIMQKLLCSRHIEYLVIDLEFKIVEASWGVNRFAEESFQLGNDVRHAFPELMGLDDIILDIFQDQIENFELKGISRISENFADIYIDINLIKHISNKGDKGILIIIEDSTERMLIEQKLGQFAKEYSLALVALSQGKNYLDKVIDSMTDVMFVVNPLGTIKTVNKATINLFEYSEVELINININLIAPAKKFQLIINSINPSLSPESILVKNVEIPCLTKTGKILFISFSISEIRGEKHEIQEFLLVGRDITERKKNEVLIRQQTEHDRVLKTITNQIRNSLSLEAILTRTVAEVQQFLQVDRVLFYRLNDDLQKTVAAEAVSQRKIPPLQTRLYHRYFSENVKHYQQGEICLISDIEEPDKIKCDPNSISLLRELKVKAHLVFPLINNNELWGLLMANHYYQSREWQPGEIDLLEQLVAQVAIAVHQAELYEQLQDANRELEELARTDSLTSIGNRGHFNRTLNWEWKRNAREQTPISLILCDVDYFKLYNDTYGHVNGDLCLKKIADILRKTGKRPGDLAARYGGEEFALILPNTPQEGAVHLANVLLQKVRDSQIPHRTSLISHYVTISIGVATVIPPNNTLPETILIKAADRALYQAKEQGRDRALVSLDYSPD